MPAAMVHSGIEGGKPFHSRGHSGGPSHQYEEAERDEIANIMNYPYQGVISRQQEGNPITLANTLLPYVLCQGQKSFAGGSI